MAFYNALQMFQITSFRYISRYLVCGDPTPSVAGPAEESSSRDGRSTSEVVDGAAAVAKVSTTVGITEGPPTGTSAVVSVQEGDLMVDLTKKGIKRRSSCGKIK